MYHPFCEIIFTGKKLLSFKDVKNFLYLKWNCVKWRDGSHEIDYGKEIEAIELNVITANQNKISTFIWSLFNSDEPTQCPNEDFSPNLNQTENPIEPNETVAQPKNDEVDDGVNLDDESKTKLQEIYVLILTTMTVILFGIIFGMFISSLGFNSQIGNDIKSISFQNNAKPFQNNILTC